MKTNVSLVTLNFEAKHSIKQFIEDNYKDSEYVDICNFSKPYDLIQEIKSGKPSLIFFNVAKKSELADGLAVLKALKKYIDKRTVRVACVLGVDNKKIVRLLNKNNCRNIFESNCDKKMLKVKTERWVVSLKNKAEQKSKIKNEINSSGQVYQLVEPIELKSDYWLVDESKVRKIFGKFIISIKGPSSHAVSWKAMPKQAYEKDTVWKLIISNEYQKLLNLEEGSWYYKGNEPEFNWEELAWHFSGTRPQLYFQDKKTVIAKRFNYNNILLLAENSSTAKDHEELIVGTLDKSYVIKMNRSMSGYMRGDVSLTEEEAGNLEGEALTDYLNNLPLSGEIDVNKKTTQMGDIYFDEIDAGPLSGNFLNDKVADNFEFEYDDPLDQQPMSLESGKLDLKLFILDEQKKQVAVVGRLDDFSTDFMVVELPKNTLSMKDEITSELTFHYLGREIKVNSKGSVDALDPIENKAAEFVSIALDNFNKKQMDEFLELYSERQANIHRFMKRAKGH